MDENNADKKIEPGIELDRLIAEKVFGWWQDSDIGGPRVMWFERARAEEIMGSLPYPTVDESLRLDRFSTDIKAAWILVEKFEMHVVPWQQNWFMYKNDKFILPAWEGVGWTAFKRGDFSPGGIRNAAPTAPHAICLAALFYASERDE